MNSSPLIITVCCYDYIINVRANVRHLRVQHGQKTLLFPLLTSDYGPFSPVYEGDEEAGTLHILQVSLKKASERE
jgi:hypothetical protein